MNITWTIIDGLPNDIKEQLEFILGEPPDNE